VHLENPEHQVTPAHQANPRMYHAKSPPHHHANHAPMDHQDHPVPLDLPANLENLEHLADLAQTHPPDHPVPPAHLDHLDQKDSLEALETQARLHNHNHLYLESLESPEMSDHLVLKVHPANLERTENQEQEAAKVPKARLVHPAAMAYQVLQAPTAHQVLPERRVFVPSTAHWTVAYFSKMAQDVKRLNVNTTLIPKRHNYLFLIFPFSVFLIYFRTPHCYRYLMSTLLYYFLSFSYAVFTKPSFCHCCPDPVLMCSSLSSISEN